jgi:antitoxin component of MazEF toxin-antitoxin module
MAKKNSQKNVRVRHLTKIAGGSSYAIVIPIEFIRQMGWKDHQKLVIRKYGSKIVVSDWEPEG